MTGGNMKQKHLEQSPTLRGALRQGQEILERAGVPEAGLDAWILMEYAVKVTRSQYYMDPDREIPEEEFSRYMEVVRRRADRIPLQHITGEQEFMGFSFQVNPHVLIPRQDTEILVETALEKMEDHMRILDLCTGSGCIVISLCRMLREGRGKAWDLEFEGSDISEDALTTARENARRLGAEVRFVSGDLFENAEGTYDMIVSNPPYIPTSQIMELQDEVRLHDPLRALDGKEDGLYFYRRIVSEAGGYLADQGWLIFEIGCDQREQVEALLEKAGYTQVSAKKDLAGLDRVVMGRYNKA